MSKPPALKLNLMPALALEPRLLKAVDRIIEASESRNTRRAYNAAFAKFEAWCQRRSVMPLPAAPALVATYLVDMADTGAGEALAAGAKPATVSLAVAAIAARHRDKGFEQLDTRAPEIRKALKGIRRAYAAPQAQAAPLKPTMIRAILADLEDSSIERRDAALLALLFAGALRRSELVGLDYHEAGDGDGYLQLSDVAVEIVLLRSKSRTDVETVRIPRADNPGWVNALEQWITGAEIQPGAPFFRSIKKGGRVEASRLSDTGVSLVVKARVSKHLVAHGWTREAADAEANKYSGHSGRVGMYVAASEAGVPIEAVAALARHKSLNVAQKYARRADQLRRAPSKNAAVAI